MNNKNANFFKKLTNLKFGQIGCYKSVGNLHGPSLPKNKCSAAKMDSSQCQVGNSFNLLIRGDLRTTKCL